MRKKYLNPINRLLVVEFIDGESHFLIYGQTVISDKTAVRVDSGLVVTELAEDTAVPPKTEDKALRKISAKKSQEITT